MATMKRVSKISAPKPKSEELVLRQIDAYNARDVNAFLALYSTDAEIIRLPDREAYLRGHEQMRARYGKMFADSPELICKVDSSWATDSFVALREKVSGMNGRKGEVDCLAIYQVENGLIRRLWLAQG
jgi:hypothetical protein